MKPKHTATIPMKFRSHAAIFHTSLPREEQAVKILCLVLAFCVLSYITLVSMSIVNVIASKEAGDEMTKLRGIVADLEHDYFALSEAVTEENGISLDLTPVSATHYVKNSSTVGAATSKYGDI